MLNEDQSRAISILSNAATALKSVPGSGVAVENILKQIEALSAPAEADNTLRGGSYPIDGSGWTLNIVDGAFSLHDDKGVVRLRAKAAPVPEAAEPEPSFEATLAKMDTRAAYGLLSSLMFASKEDPAETARRVSLVAEKLGIVVISL